MNPELVTTIIIGIGLLISFRQAIKIARSENRNWTAAIPILIPWIPAMIVFIAVLIWGLVL